MRGGAEIVILVLARVGIRVSQFEGKVVPLLVGLVVGRTCLEGQQCDAIVVRLAGFFLVEVHERPCQHTVPPLPRAVVAPAQLVQVAFDADVLQSTHLDLLPLVRHGVHIAPVHGRLHGRL